jgi:hypothetical protein
VAILAWPVAYKRFQRERPITALGPPYSFLGHSPDQIYALLIVADGAPGLISGRYRVQNLALAGERSAEDDEPVIYQGVHEARVCVPTLLFEQIARPLPWTTTLEPHCEEHRLD